MIVLYFGQVKCSGSFIYAVVGLSLVQSYIRETIDEQYETAGSPQSRRRKSWADVCGSYVAYTSFFVARARHVQRYLAVCRTYYVRTSCWILSKTQRERQ